MQALDDWTRLAFGLIVVIIALLALRNPLPRWGADVDDDETQQNPLAQEDSEAGR